MRRYLLAVTLAVAAATTTPSHADTLISQPTIYNPPAMTSSGGSTAYDDFRLDNPALVTTLTWWGQASSDASTFRISFLGTRNGNEPDPTNRYFDQTLSVTGTDEQPFMLGDRTEYYVTRYSVTFDLPVYLPGDTDLYVSVYATDSDYGWGWALSDSDPGKGAIDRDCVDAGYGACFVGENSGELFGGSYNLAWQLDGTAASAPETATWMMSIIGFGGIGGLVRRDRSRTPCVARA